AGPIDHPELIEPFTGALTRNLNRAKWFATTNFAGSQGAFFHSDLWPFEPDPANCTTKNRHQLAYMPWGYSWGMDGHSAAVLWDYYKFNPTTASLNAIYPVLQQFALFYCSMLEQCALVNGVRKIGPSYFPENGSYGQYNVCYDISFINCCLKAALTAASLEGDTALVNRISALLPEMPNYSTVNDVTASVNGTIVEEWLGSGVQAHDNHGTSVQAIFPAGQIGIFSSAADQALYTRTIQHVENVTTHANSNVTINIARARLGLGSDAIANAKICFDTGSAYSPQQPNGLFYWNGHGYYVCEQVCIARLVSELLLQSVGDVIRIFPAWPAGTDGHFSRLLAQGGFEVSADRISNVIQNVTIRSTQGVSASVAAPWSGFGVNVVAQSTGSSVPTTNSNGIYTFATTAGETYQLSPGAATIAPSAPSGLTASAGDTVIALSWTPGTAATSYIIQRSTDGVNFTTIGTATGTGYVDDGLSNGTTYYYEVSSVNNIGQSANSSAVSASPSNQGSISIDFQGGSSNGIPSLMSSSEIAGVFPAGNWNNAAGASGSASSLVQSDGTATSASVTWSCANVWSTSIADTAGNYRMMKGYLDTTSSSTTTVTVSGLPSTLASAGYSVYVYRDGDNGSSTHTGSYKVGTTTITATDSANTNFSGTFTQASNSAGNYVVFTGQTGTSFTLTAQPTSARAPINGIQIVGKITKTAPLAPTGLAAGTVTSSAVQLAWTDNATNESSYRIEYSPSGANNWTIASQVPAGSTSYQVTGLNAGAAYDFRVQAMSSAGASSWATATITTLTAYQQWKVNNNLPVNTPDSATPDGDGIPILLKYATGMAVGTPGASPVASSASGSNPLKLTFLRLSPAPVTYTVQASTDMATWTTVATLAKGSDTWSGSAGISEPGSGTTRTTTITDSASPSANARRFLRLQVMP
ncbi:MAG TPA: fibronectin type III domain-containing protein, partial [Chthoniobacterales bacterium]